MANVEIREALPEDAVLLAKDLREADRKEILAFGLSEEAVLRDGISKALYAKTALVDGEIAAMWGLEGNSLGSTGHPWLLTGEKVKNVSPWTFVSIYKQQVSDMLQLFPTLVNFVDTRYTQSVRLLEMLGFKLYPSIPLGEDRIMFSKFELKAGV